MPQKVIIFTADDYGESSTVNAAVLRGFKEGVLRSASLMASGEAFEEAVEIARENPDLDIGIHLVLVDGRSLLPHREIPGLVNLQGIFPDSPTLAGLRYFFLPQLKRQILREMEAQVRKIKETGLAISHLNSHHHLHMHPVVFPLVAQMAREHKIPWVRVTVEPFFPGLRAGGKSLLSRHSLQRGIHLFPFYLLSSSARKILTSEHLLSGSSLFGLLDYGNLTEEYLLRLIPRVNGTVEICTHPGPGGMAGGDLEILLSPALKRLIEKDQVTLSSFRSVIERPGR